MTAKEATESRKRASNPNRGSKPGERRGGRKPGVPNKLTAAVKEVAAQYTEQAILTLAEIMQDDEAPHPARVSAANALLDRAHGKPGQSVDLTGDMAFKGLEVIVRR